MSPDEITVTLRVDAARSLIAALPRCQACGVMAAEVRLVEPGAYDVAVCMSCASTRPEGRAEPVPHAEALGAIETALLRGAGL
ncbi:MAG: hypothetical protein IPM35_02655 [Myxococcales bacterium]|nr:hypothetical protein [Myxococcales bacterium]